MSDKIKDWEQGSVRFVSRPAQIGKSDLAKDYRGTYVPGRGFTGSGSAQAGSPAHQSVDKESVQGVKDIINPIPRNVGSAMRTKMGKSKEKCVMASMMDKACAASKGARLVPEAKPTEKGYAQGEPRKLYLQPPKGQQGKEFPVSFSTMPGPSAEGKKQEMGKSADGKEKGDFPESKKMTYGEGRISAHKRESLKPGQFAIRGKAMKRHGLEPKGEESGRYPIHDLAHARNALARAAQSGDPKLEAAVKRAVYAKYPELKERKKEREGENVDKGRLARETQGPRELGGALAGATMQAGEAAKPQYTVSSGSGEGSKVHGTGMTLPKATRLQTKAAARNPGREFHLVKQGDEEPFDTISYGGSQKKVTTSKAEKSVAKSILDAMIEKAGPANDANEPGPVSGTPHGGIGPAQTSTGSMEYPNRGPGQAHVGGAAHGGRGPAQTSTQANYPNRGPAQTSVGALQGPGNDGQVSKAITAMSVPRLPRALAAAAVEQWRDAPRVGTRLNAVGDMSGPLHGDLIDSVDEYVATVQRPILKACSGCGRTYTLRKSNDPCPTCSALPRGNMTKSRGGMLIPAVIDD